MIKIFTAINGFVKSCWRLFLLLTSCTWGQFRYTSISLWAGLTDWQSLTKLETGLQVELQMTIICVTGKDSFSNIKWFDKLANTVDVTDIIGKDRFTNSWWFNELANTTDLTDITSSCLETNCFTNMWWFNEFTNATAVTDITISYFTWT